MSSAKTTLAASLLAFWLALGSYSNAAAPEKKDEKPDDEKTQLNKALGMAASLGQLDKVKELLKKGADIQWRNPADNGKTPLTRSVLNGKFEVVKYLLDNGADINYPDGSGRYPVYFCCIGSNVDLLKFLIAKGGDKDLNRGTFHILVSLCDHGQGLPEFIPILVKAGADPNAIRNHMTPLIAAIRLDPKYPGRAEKSREYIKALIEAKADLNLKDTREKLSPLQWAKKRGDKDIIEMLEKAGAQE